MMITKKDRIALVFSAITLVLSFALLFSVDAAVGVLGICGLIGYWGYRYIKNDISFIKEK